MWVQSIKRSGSAKIPNLVISLEHHHNLQLRMEIRLFEQTVCVHYNLTGNNVNIVPQV